MQRKCIPCFQIWSALCQHIRYYIADILDKPSIHSSAKVVPHKLMVSYKIYMHFNKEL